MVNLVSLHNSCSHETQLCKVCYFYIFVNEISLRKKSYIFSENAQIMTTITVMAINVGALLGVLIWALHRRLEINNLKHTADRVSPS